MAKALKYWYEWRDLENTLFKEEIWVEGFSGTAEELKAGSEPLTKSYNKDVGEKYLGGIVPFVVNVSAKSTSTFKATEFTGENYGDAILKHKQGSTVLFNAIIVPFEGMDEDLDDGFYKVQLSAECGLNYLKSIVFEPTKTRKTLLNIINTCIGNIPYIDSFGYYVVDNTATNDGTATGLNYYDTFIDDRQFTGMNCYDVIKDVIQEYGQLVFASGRWNIFNISNISKENSTFRIYNSSVALTSSGTYTRPTKDIRRIAGGNFGRMFSQQGLKVEKKASQKRSILTNSDFASDTGWTYNGLASILFEISDGKLKNKGNTYFTYEGSTPDTSYVQSPAATFYPFESVFNLATKQRLQLNIKASKGKYIKNLRLQIYAVQSGGTHTYYLTAENTWYRALLGEPTPFYYMSFEADKDTQIEIPQVPYLETGYSTNFTNIIPEFGEFLPYPYGQPTTNLPYTFYVRVYMPERVYDTFGFPTTLLDFSSDIDYLNLNVAEVGTEITDGFIKKFGLEEKKDRDLNFTIKLGVGYPSFPIGFDSLFRDNSTTTQITLFNGVAIEQHIADSYLSVLGTRQKIYTGTVEGDVEFSDLLLIDSQKYRIHNLQQNFRMRQHTIKAVSLGVGADTLEELPLTNFDILIDQESLQRTVTEELRKKYGDTFGMKFVDKNFEVGILADGQKSLRLREDVRVDKLYSQEAYLRTASDGTIKDVATDTSGNFTLTKPAENGTYATREWANNNAWIIGGNTLTSEGKFGSLNAQDVVFVANNVSYLSMYQAGGLMIHKDTTFEGDILGEGNITIQKGNPRLRLRDSGGSVHTNGFDLHVDGDEFIIDDNTHSRNILRNYLNSTTHITEFDADEYYFKDGATVYASLIGGNLNLPSLTASRLVGTDANDNIISLDTATYPSFTELAHLKGVTGAIQTQINGKFNTPTGLTTNYVTKWDGTALANSQIFDNGSNIGISTATPTQRLDVNGNTRLRERVEMQPSRRIGAGLDFGNVIEAGSGYLEFYNSWTGNTSLVNTTGFAAITLHTNNTERFRILSNGNVGIGTTSPSYKLEIRHDINGEAAIRLDNRATASSGTMNSIIFGGYRDSQPIYDVAKISAIHKAGVAGDLNHAGDLAFYTQLASASAVPELLTERMRISSVGFVGINKTNPTEYLDVNGTSRTTNLKITNGAAVGRVWQCNNADGSGAWVSPLTSERYIGEWAANSGVAPSATPTTGDYWVVNTPGTYLGITYAAGDEAYYNGTTYLKRSNYLTLPIATASVLGGIKIGSGLSIDGGGVVSVSTLNQNTTGSAATLTTARTIAISGDATWSVSFNGSANVTAALTLANIATAGTYRSVTVNAKGLVTAGTNPTTISGYGITDAYTKTESDGRYIDLTTDQTITSGVKTFPVNVETRFGNGFDITRTNIFNIFQNWTFGTLSTKRFTGSAVGGALIDMLEAHSFRIRNGSDIKADFQSAGLVLGSSTSVTAATERLHVVGNIRYSNLLKPNNIAGANGQFLKTSGTQDLWATLVHGDISNLSSYTGFDTRYVDKTTTQEVGGSKTFTGTTSVQDLFVLGKLYDSLLEEGISGKFLMSTGTGTEWKSLTTSYISNLSSYTGFDARYFTETESDARFVALGGSYANPSWITSLAYSKLTGVPSFLTSVDLATNVSGVLPITNGGTGSSTKNFVDLTTNQTVAGNKTFSGITYFGNQGGYIDATSGTSFQGTRIFADNSLLITTLSDIRFTTRISGASTTRRERMILNSTGLRIRQYGVDENYLQATERLHVDGNILYTGTLKPNDTAPTTGQFLKATSASANAWATLVSGDIPSLDASKITSGTFADARIESASIWNAKQSALNGTGFVKVSGTTVSYDNNTYLTANQTVNLIGVVSGSGSTEIITTISNSALTIAMTNGLQSALDAKMPAILGNTAQVLTWDGGGYNFMDVTNKPIKLNPAEIGVGNEFGLLESRSEFKYENKLLSISDKTNISKKITLGMIGNNGIVTVSGGGDIELFGERLRLSRLTSSITERLLVIDSNGYVTAKQVSVGGGVSQGITEVLSTNNMATNSQLFFNATQSQSPSLIQFRINGTNTGRIFSDELLNGSRIGIHAENNTSLSLVTNNGDIVIGSGNNDRKVIIGNQNVESKLILNGYSYNFHILGHQGNWGGGNTLPQNGDLIVMEFFDNSFKVRNVKKTLGYDSNKTYLTLD